MDPASLNEPQRQAVEHPSGPLLILAGAGSGKTRVLTMRIARLIREGADSERILALTFTNKAAREMKSRLAAMLGRSPEGLWVGTFHSIAARMLRPHADRLGYRAGFAIFDEDDARALLKRTFADLDLDPRKNPIADLAEQMSKAKSEMLLPPDVKGRKASDRALRVVYERYQALAQESNGMDFDDLILNLVRLLRSDAEVLESWQARFDHILVDEYQDTDRAQYELLRLLSGSHHNLTVVGDDDQTIYAFRGADVRNILDFQIDHPEVCVVKLEQNYRSTRAILDVAHHVISHNPERTEKRLWTVQGEGRRPVLLLAPDDDAEAEHIGDEIMRLTRSDGFGHGDFAILYRTNAQSRSFERALMERRIPYHLVGGLRFWDRREVKDVVAYLKLLANPSDAVSFDRIANVPKRRISERTVQAAIGVAAASGVSILDVCAMPSQVDVKPEAQQALLSFHQQVGSLAADLPHRRPMELIQLLIRHCALAEHYDDGSTAGRARLDNLAQLRDMARDYDRHAPEKALERFLTDIAMASEADDTEANDRVTLITLHMAKGLEFPVVFLTGLEDKMLPHERALAEAGGLEEERRLFYVGITRAQRLLYLSVANVRFIFNKSIALAPSQFLYHIPGELMELVELSGHRSHGIARHVGVNEATA